MFEDPAPHGSGPRVLVVTNIHPLPDRPAQGMFVAEQVASLRARDDLARVDTVVVDGVADTRNYARGVLDVRRAVRRLRPDVVHVHYGLTGPVVLAARPRRPVVVTYHGSDLAFKPWQRNVSRAVARAVAKNVCVSRAGVALVGAPAEWLPCGIDLGAFRPRDRTAARAAWGVDDADLALLFPGQRGRPVKGYPRYRQVLEVLAARGIRTAELRLEDVPRERVPELFAAADVLTMCSLSEGAPVSIMEALASGLPIVAPPVGEVAAMLEGEPGARVLEFDPERFADAVLEVPRPPARQPAAGARRYDAGAVAERLAAIYHDLAAR